MGVGDEVVVIKTSTATYTVYLAEKATAQVGEQAGAVVISADGKNRNWMD